MEANGNGQHLPSNPTAKYSRVPNGRNNLGLSQAYMLRNTAADKALILKDKRPDDTKEQCAIAKALKDLANVWDNASERIRILRGRPLPGSLKPKAPARKKAQRTGPLFSDDSAATSSTEQPPTEQGQ